MVTKSVCLAPLEALLLCLAQLAAGGCAGWKRVPERLGSWLIPLKVW